MAQRILVKLSAPQRLSVKTQIMKYDITVIGSGPGGYVAAIRAAQLGFKTALIEKYDTLGGTCLNVGCIPSKALLDSSEHFHNAEKNFEKHGINLKSLEVDLPLMIKRKDDVVSQTTQGIEFLMKKNKIDVHHGVGHFISKNKIGITKSDGATVEIETDKTIIATGSKPASLPFIKIDKKRIITSTEALNITSLPKTMTIIGAGVIGLELGSVFARLGTLVNVVEYMDTILPGMDVDISKDLMRSLKKLGVKFHLSHKVSAAKATAKTTTTTAENSKGETVEFKSDYCLVAVGRRAFTDGLGLENIGVKTDKHGKISVNESLETSVGGVYAIGDVVAGPMLAHKAEEEGVFVAEQIAGQKPHINYLLIPGVVYTWPEVAVVGNTEEHLKDQKRAYKSGSFPFRASGRARASMDIDGQIKVLADAQTDELLGVHMVGPRAADMIAQAVTAMEFRASAEDVARMVHAHPTYTEAFKEACLAATENRALHI